MSSVLEALGQVEYNYECLPQMRVAREALSLSSDCILWELSGGWARLLGACSLLLARSDLTNWTRPSLKKFNEFVLYQMMAAIAFLKSTELLCMNRNFKTRPTPNIDRDMTSRMFRPAGLYLTAFKC